MNIRRTLTVAALAVVAALAFAAPAGAATTAPANICPPGGDITCGPAAHMGCANHQVYATTHVAHNPYPAQIWYLQDNNSPYKYGKPVYAGNKQPFTVRVDFGVHYLKPGYVDVWGSQVKTHSGYWRVDVHGGKRCP